MANKIMMENYFEVKDFLSSIQNSLIRILKHTGPLTRNDLVSQLNTPRTTIYDNLLKLQKRKVVEKFTRNDGKKGRPLVFWKIKD